MIGLPAFDDGEVAAGGVLEDVVSSVDFRNCLAFGDRRAVTGRGVEGRNARTAGAHLLRQGALGGEFDFQLTVEQLLLEQGVLADVRGDHLADLAIFQQHAEAEAIHAAVVGNYGEVLAAAPADSRDEVFRDATQAKAAGQYGHAVREPCQGLFIGTDAFVESRHGAVPLSCSVSIPVVSTGCLYLNIEPASTSLIHLLSLFL